MKVQPSTGSASGADLHSADSHSADLHSVARLQAEVRALRLAAAGLTGELPESLAERFPVDAGLGRSTGELLVRSLAESAGEVDGGFIDPGPGAAASVLLALHHAWELPEVAIVDAAVVAGRLANAALAWQASATAALAERREAAARLNLVTAIGEAEDDPAALQVPSGEGIGAGYTWNDLDDAIDLARRSAIAEVAVACGVTEYRLGRHLTLLRESLEEHPLVAKAVRCGRVDLARAAVITDVTGTVSDHLQRWRIERPAVDAAARGVTIATLRRLLEGLLAQEAPEEHAWFTRREHATRTGVKVRAAGYGLASMTVTADVGLIEEAAAAVKTLTELAATPEDPAHTGYANPAHVVLEELINAAEHGYAFEGASGGGATVQINLTVPLSTLFDEQAERAATASDPADESTSNPPAEPTDPLGGGCSIAPDHEPTAANAAADSAEQSNPEPPNPEPPSADSTVGERLHGAAFRRPSAAGLRRPPGGADAPAALAGYGWIPAALAREIVHEYGARATWRCHYVDDAHDSPHFGTVVGVGRAAHDPTYAPSLGTRTLVIARDHTCRFPSCHRAAAACDLDHVTPHAESGTTCSESLIALCRHHHRLKHHGGFTPRRDGATVVWTTPTGRQLRVEPRRYLREQATIPDPELPPPF